jgi:hypothetical protein
MKNLRKNVAHPLESRIEEMYVRIEDVEKEAEKLTWRHPERLPKKTGQSVGTPATQRGSTG